MRLRNSTSTTRSHPWRASEEGHIASNILRRFIDQRLERYAEDRNQPSLDASSGLSPWLHFGHISSAEVVHAVLQAEGWDPTSITGPNDGRRSGWWGSLRECGGVPRPDHHMARTRLQRRRQRSVAPPLRIDSRLGSHQSGGARRRQAGRIHLRGTRGSPNRGRDLERRPTPTSNRWHHPELPPHALGKKILQWAPDPKTAADWMVALNDRWALDGRDPNSYTGIYWVLGRHDRAWGPERPIFGKVRYMTSENTRRKYRIGPYLDRYGD